MVISDTTTTAIGSEGPKAYEALLANNIQIVPSRLAVPRGGKYIVVKDRIGILRLPFASALILLEWLVLKRYVPEQYCRTYITGGNLWYVFGRKCEWNHWAFGSELELYRVLHWLHSKDLRYVVTTGSIGESTLRKAVRRFNDELQMTTQIKIMQERSALRSS